MHDQRRGSMETSFLEFNLGVRKKKAKAKMHPATGMLDKCKLKGKKKSLLK